MIESYTFTMKEVKGQEAESSALLPPPGPQKKMHIGAAALQSACAGV